MPDNRTTQNQESANGGGSNSRKEYHFPAALENPKEFMPYIKFSRHAVVPLTDLDGDDYVGGGSENPEFSGGDAGSSGGNGSSTIRGTDELVDPREKSIIKLFIPPTVSETNSATYDTEEMPFIQSMINGMGSFNGEPMKIKDALKRMTEGGSTGESVMGAIDAAAIAGSAAFTSQLRKLMRGNTIARAITGKAVNPQMTYLFKTVSNRAFSFQFIMNATNEAESKQIRSIVKEFKSIMYPSTTQNEGFGITLATSRDDPGRDFYLKTPDVVRVRYYYGDAEHKWLHKFKDCVVKNVNVEYGGQSGTWTQFGGFTEEGGAPTQVSLSIDIEEMSIVTQQDVEQKGM